MPTSILEVAPAVLHYLWEVRPADRPLRVLDVGPGWGKYATLVREYVDPAAQLAAVEAWPAYIEDHRLDRLYDLIVAGDIRDQPDTWLDGFDAVLMVDVLEHIPKDEALRVLDRIGGWIVIATPRHFFENPPELPEPEAHVSHWTVADFEATGRLDGYHHDHFRDPGVIVCRLRPK